MSRHPAGSSDQFWWPDGNPALRALCVVQSPQVQFFVEAVLDPEAQSTADR